MRVGAGNNSLRTQRRDSINDATGEGHVTSWDYVFRQSSWQTLREESVFLVEESEPARVVDADSEEVILSLDWLLIQEGSPL